MGKAKFSITPNNHVEFYKEGENFFEKYLEAIRGAKKNIHLQTYIFDLDSFGTKVKNELINASKRGVQVYLLVDGIGSSKLTDTDELDFLENGVHFCRFNSLHLKWFYKWGRRLHHKILLIDEKEGFVGGINVLSSDNLEIKAPRLDFAVYLSGPFSVQLANYCKYLFNKSYSKNLPFSVSKEFNIHSSGYNLTLSVNDWILGRSKITKQYAKKTTSASIQITIINPYFFPRKKFMKQLTEAARRNVKVRLILPKYSDWPTYIYASEYLYKYFLSRGVEIYQWKESILHGKLATVDNSWTTIGSFNLNYTSYQQNLEMNVDIHSHEFTKFLNTEIETWITTGCEKLDLINFSQKASWIIRSKRLFFYLILSIIANFSIGLSFREDKEKVLQFLNIARFYLALIFFFLALLGLFIKPIPVIPFFIVSVFFVYRQFSLNKLRP
jgi:cardiolipin synthase